MTKPKVSIIVIYKNAQDTIKNCIDSILNQKFDDYELICVNNGSNDKSEELVQSASQSDERVKLINTGSEIELEKAKSMALSLAQGDYICFIAPEQVIYESFHGGITPEVLFNSGEKLNIENGKIYKREYLENSAIIDLIIQGKLGIYCAQLTDIVKNYENYIKTSLDKGAKTAIETINNKEYEIVSRINQLEKTIYENRNYSQNEAQTLSNELKNSVNSLKDMVYGDITKIYDYINSEINKKGEEINKVYEEITNNYKYTESLNASAKQELHERLGREINEVNEKLINQVQIKEVPSNTAENSSRDEDIEQIYTRINEMNTMFYSELTKIYTEINEKMNEKLAKLKEEILQERG